MSFLSVFRGLRNNSPGDSSGLEGVITFFGAHHALKGEKVLALNGVKGLLIPGPREISPNCGTALRFDFSKKETVKKLLSDNDILFEEIHYYPV